MFEIRLLWPKFTGQKEHDALLVRTYESWKRIWRPEFAALEQNFEFHSDPFTRQKQILVLLKDGEYLGSLMWRDLDLASPIDRDDSYVCFWPSGALDLLEKKSRRALVCSGFTIDRQFLGIKIDGYNMKDLLVAISLHYFKQSDHRLMICLTRNSRKINQYAAKIGWTPIGEVNFKGEKSEMLYCESAAVPLLPKSLDDLIRAAWKPEFRDQEFDQHISA